MGLRTPPVVVAHWLTRGHCTLIRNNWHLLPYEQLLELIGWPAKKLEFALLEEDFLWIKLGKLKPQAEPLRFTPLTPDQVRQTAALRRVARTHFPAGRTARHTEPPFAFYDAFCKPVMRRPPAQRGGPFDLRLIFSYSAVYGDSLLHPELDPYPDGLLARMAEMGVNAVWLPGHLYLMTPWKPDPALSKGWQTRLKNLDLLAKRVARHGMGLYLYLNEPRAIPTSSKTFDVHPEWKGIDYPDLGVRGLCTSNPAVLDLVRDATAGLFRAAPDLAGVFTINMSEWPTHCASRGRKADCPHCANRPTEELIADVVRATADGAHSVKPDARVIVWTWSWHPDWQHQAIDLLPTTVDLMSTSEKGLASRTAGVEVTVGDYSISRVGPSQWSLDMWEHARRRGMRVVAKVMFNSSWELSAVPYLPVVDLVEEHLTKLRKAGATGLMLSWTNGSYPGGNLDLIDKSAADVAVERYGAKAAPQVRKAWSAFSRAFREYPFSVGVVYNAPHNCGPMNLLYATPTGYASTMVQGLPYDNLKGWRNVYPEDVFEDQFRKLSVGWKRGLALLEKAARLVPKAKRANYTELDRMARAAYCHFRSAYLQIVFVRTRDGKLPEKARNAKLVRVLNEEIELAKTLHGLVLQDSRIGFEAANHYSYTANDLKEKVLNCESLREVFGKR
ncbi:MAG: hypothetical protein A3K19_03860 [Lentisphaerae bacterium RIFOXYB12_FULL_65_16]|nr:MAG: hypothetical protein A3K18_03005 [Lentisphaerae bacterium RIFOXYA12_64_32]OGV89298.1 MAG: hypothetical protein A3K19_03860 [Lentisphaerae bacterium RIFOXYB12_FULL_65_16]